MRISSYGFEGQILRGIPLVALTWAIACVGEADLPDPPDLGALVAAYEGPTHAVTEPELLATATSGLQTLNLVRAGGDDTYVQEAAEDIGQRARAQATIGKDLRFNVAVRVDRTCAGWEAGSNRPDRAANGHLALTGVLRSSVADPVVWGEAEGCRQRISTSAGPARGFIDGVVEMYVYGGLTSDISARELLVHVRGTIGNDVVRGRGNFDFRISDRGLETRVPFPDGTFAIVTLTATRLELRGTNGTFGCALNATQCGPLQ